ncbi:hypothetical protein BCY91_04235 [Pelobium manganitolerans]|uniref:Putative auto-transporter adhesin head GIN domain-containing protein n=1 Tax=Pelobium manganitolerans TaxID=1842495 RepID=A0A419S5W9_9SPHI|nr:DUF2807 domain-containing protein [Pelobium manganitolerans]RKD16106.1 hypothetical protein BCY91_04235 [Pelobium manganitolerans]
MRTYLILLTSILYLSACSKDRLRGEGPTVTESRSINASELQTVRVNGSTKLHISYGTVPELKVKGYGNLVAALSTTLKNGVLTVEFENHYNVRNDNTEVFLILPKSPNIYLNGSADAFISGNFEPVNHIFFKINGSANINAGAFVAESLDVNISGSGNVNLVNIDASDANVSISGSGEVKTKVSDKLLVAISGSGRVLYLGNPEVQSNISGSGKVQKI